MNGGPILLLVPGFPADESDLTCIPAVQNYVEALAHRYPPDQVEVVAFQYPYDRRTYRWHGVRVHALGGANAASAKPLTWMRALSTCRRLMKRPERGGRDRQRGSNGPRRGSEAPQRGVIHSFWVGECALVGSLLARSHGWKHVVSIGGQEVRRHTMYGRFLRHASFSLTAGSEHAASAAQRTLRRPVDAVVPLGLDIQRFSAQKHADRPIDVLVVGSLTPIKRVVDVVDVAQRLLNERPGLSLAIVGDGPERARLLEWIRGAGLTEHITVHGSQPREEVLRLMRRSKVLLHPSEYESQGYVFLEALASGMYVVCRDVGFHPDSPNVDHASSIDEMAAAVARRLAQVHDPKSVLVPTADQSVDAFASIYES